MMPIKSIFFLFVIVICIVMLVSYAFTGDFKFWEMITMGIKTGTLYIGGVTANVTGIVMNQSVGVDIGPCSYTNPNSCTIGGAPNTVRRTTVKAVIYRESGDCNTGLTVVGYLCNGTVAACRPGAGSDYTLTSQAIPSQLSFNGEQWFGPSNNLYCNYTGYFDMEYWKHYGSWTVNISTLVVGDNSLRNYTKMSLYYQEFNSLDYPYPGGSGIPLGLVKSNQWNFGTNGNKSVNTGNIRLNVSLNATNFTDFTTSQNSINVHGSGTVGSFAVHNISGNPFSSLYNYENMSSDPSGPDTGSNVEVWFPVTGMRRCGILSCVSDEDGGFNEANYTLMWSIYVPAAQAAGTYNNSIYVNSYTLPS